MPQRPTRVAEARQHPRLKVPAMYTLVRVKREGEHRFESHGHIYDVSLSGMRFELDEPMPVGQSVTVRAMLPGSNRQTTFEATGQVVRWHDQDKADQRGPVRMGLTFTGFAAPSDQERLANYLGDTGHQRLRAA